MNKIRLYVYTLAILDPLREEYLYPIHFSIYFYL